MKVARLEGLWCDCWTARSEMADRLPLLPAARCQVDTLTIFFVLDLGESIAHSYLHFTDTNTWSWREVME
jgi:hypothetical protein